MVYEQIVDDVPDERAKRGNIPDDLSRDVYCVLGMPVDAVSMQSCLHRIQSAAREHKPFLISTPNLNFLINSRSDPEFRESLLLSDLCAADGMPIVWLSWLLGIPLRNRVAGSDIFDALKMHGNVSDPLRVFLFGGADGAAAGAARAINAAQCGLYCIGALNPGFGSIDELSQKDIVDNINSSGADFLVVSLGAKKGQLWLRRNHGNLAIPVRAHLGASINFQAGRIARSPQIMRKLGLEWLWRIKEEPYLWRRYWDDGKALVALLIKRVLPIVIWNCWRRVRSKPAMDDFVVTETQAAQWVALYLSGSAAVPHVDKIIPTFRAAVRKGRDVVIDLSGVRWVDARFLGLLLMLRKELGANDTRMILNGVSPRLENYFRLNGLEFLFRDRVS